jgi:hypothetical protein
MSTLNDETFEECVDRLVQRYRSISTNQFDQLIKNHPLRFSQAYTQKLYGIFCRGVNSIGRINARKLLVCACIILDNENIREWNEARELLYILLYMWKADNPISSISYFEINMYMPIVAGDILKLKNRSRGCLSFYRR